MVPRKNAAVTSFLAQAALSVAMTACGGGDPAAPAAKQPADDGADGGAAAPDKDATAVVIDDEAVHVSGRAYWRAKALGKLGSETAQGDNVYGEIEGADGAKTAVYTLATEVADESARNQGHRDAVRDLIEPLRGTDAKARSRSLDALEALTKTQRQGPKAWIRWWDEHGDYLTYNAELQRVDVDAARKAANLPEAVGELRLRLTTDKDRYKRSEPIGLVLGLERVEGATGELWVGTRMALGTDLVLEVRAVGAGPGALPLAAAAEARAPRPEDFARLVPGQRSESRVDLRSALAEQALPPGKYAVRVEYQNALDAADHGLEGATWTGTAESVTAFFEIVPW